MQQKAAARPDSTRNSLLLTTRHLFRMSIKIRLMTMYRVLILLNPPEDAGHAPVAVHLLQRERESVPVKEFTTSYLQATLIIPAPNNGNHIHIGTNIARNLHKLHLPWGTPTTQSSVDVSFVGALLQATLIIPAPNNGSHILIYRHRHRI